MTPVSPSTASTVLTLHPPQPGPSLVRGGDRSPDTCHDARDALQPSIATDPGGPVDSDGELSTTPSPRPGGIPDKPLVATTASPQGATPTSRANEELALTRDITAPTFGPRGPCHGQIRTVMRLRIRVLRLRWAGAASPATIARSHQRATVSQPRRPTHHRHAAFVWGTPANHPCAFPPVAM